MTPTGLRLYKQEKLCSVTAIDHMFSPSSKSEGGNNSVMAYPWRAVWRTSDRGDRPKCVRFVISVPKKRLRHAVDRVRMRRVMREAYRLNRAEALGTSSVDIVFIYVADRLTPYVQSVKSVRKILGRIINTLGQPKTEATATTPSSPSKCCDE